MTAQRVPFSAPRRLPAILLGMLMGFLTAAGPVADARAADSAVVFMYHRFGENAYPSTNIRLRQFEAHLAELTNGRYTVKSLPDILAALRDGTGLPERTIGISIDDAFLSVYLEAWPRLRKAGLPFTLFVATDPIDRRRRGYMSWDQIRELARAGVTIGSQTASHLHMAASSKKRNAADLEKSNRRFEAELDRLPTIIAYPYGEYSLDVRAVAQIAGFEFGFGQHSGVLHGAADFSFLPRFALNETYGDLGRLRIAANALPLPVTDVLPADPKLTPGNNPPALGFTVVGEAVKTLGRITCYTSGLGRSRVERLGKRRIEVRPEQAFPPGRTRINCTMPAKAGRWRWYGRQFYMPKN